MLTSGNKFTHVRTSISKSSLTTKNFRLSMLVPTTCCVEMVKDGHHHWPSWKLMVMITTHSHISNWGCNPSTPLPELPSTISLVECFELGEVAIWQQRRPQCGACSLFIRSVINTAEIITIPDRWCQRVSLQAVQKRDKNYLHTTIGHVTISSGHTVPQGRQISRTTCELPEFCKMEVLECDCLQISNINIASNCIILSLIY